MKVFVAKQPIYNIFEEVIGYDLLYRKDFNKTMPSVDDDEATVEVIINTYLNIGIERLNDGKFLCLQFTEALLEQKVYAYLNSDDIIIKVSNKVLPNQKLMEIMQELKKLGFMIAIQESFFDQDYSFSHTFLPYIDMIEINFQKEASKYRMNIEELAKEYGIQLLAQEIASKDEFERAKERGYSSFQGDFFSEPLIHSSYDIPMVFSSTYYTVQDKELEEDELVDIIEKDLSFSIKLLRLINTSAVRSEKKICSIREAVAILGAEEVQKWMKLLSSSYINRDRLLGEEWMSLTLTRAKFCELIAKQIDVHTPSCYYLFGLLSAIEKINQDSMEEILQGLPLQNEMYEAFQGKENEYRTVLNLVSAVERAKWKEIRKICQQIDLTERDLFRIYAESLNWTKKMMQLEKIESGEANLLSLLSFNSL